MSSRDIVDLAKEVGYEGVEFLPTWRFVREIKKYGKLLANKQMVVSGHRDWRFDRVMMARLDNKPDWKYQLREKADLLFPTSGACLSALRKFQKYYEVPVSVTWFEDTKNFSPVMLELWGVDQGINQEKLLRWLKSDPKERGVVIDTAKIGKWLKSNNLLEKKERVLEDLFPHIFEVHYRQVKKKNKWKLGKIHESSEILKLLLNFGYKGRVVVEFGWPDLDNPPFGIVSENMDRFRELHKRVRNSINSIYK
jgi:hypothetical protein